MTISDEGGLPARTRRWAGGAGASECLGYTLRSRHTADGVGAPLGWIAHSMTLVSSIVHNMGLAGVVWAEMTIVHTLHFRLPPCATYHYPPRLLFTPIGCAVRGGAENRCAARGQIETRPLEHRVGKQLTSLYVVLL